MTVILYGDLPFKKRILNFIRFGPNGILHTFTQNVTVPEWAASTCL